MEGILSNLLIVPLACHTFKLVDFVSVYLDSNFTDVTLRDL